MQSWRSPANKQTDTSDKPGEERSNKPSATGWVAHVGIKGIEIGEVINQIFYVTYVVIGVGLSKPDPVIDENLVMGQSYTDVQRDATDNCQNYAHYGYYGKFSFLLRSLFVHLELPQEKYSPYYRLIAPNITTKSNTRPLREIAC
jgi:hypothetical protein